MCDGRWVFLDFLGKGNKTRSVAVALWVKKEIDGWLDVAGIEKGPIFRRLLANGRVGKDALTERAVWQLVRVCLGRGFLSAWHKPSVWDCRLIRRRAKDVRTRGKLCFGLVTRKSVWSSEELLLNLGCLRITAVQPAESRKKLNLGFTGIANFCRSTCWHVLRESQAERQPVTSVVCLASQASSEPRTWARYQPASPAS
jgi:hypothetical protein